jgi:hypothetical protein
MRNPDARKACDAEWEKLIAQTCWDVTKVQSWRGVARKARDTNTTIHVGSLHELCMEQRSELPLDHPDRKFKGRVVFLGDRVKNEYGEAAMFQELSSAPAALEAAKFCDAYGMIEGHVVEQSDAEQAYCQAELKGTATWIRLPPHKWPKEWHELGYTDPVCPLRLALYGHPDSGGMLENHCETVVRAHGFVTIGGSFEWRS